jgi:hypothetical protein
MVEAFAAVNVAQESGLVAISHRANCCLRRTAGNTRDKNENESAHKVGTVSKYVVTPSVRAIRRITTNVWK